MLERDPCSPLLLPRNALPYQIAPAKGRVQQLADSSRENCQCPSAHHLRSGTSLKAAVPPERNPRLRRTGAGSLLYVCPRSHPCPRETSNRLGTTPVRRPGL